jgi:hypothetical protein
MKTVEPFLARKGTDIPYHCRRLAIDPGKNSTGWAVFDHVGLLVACGLHYPPLLIALDLAIEVPQVYPRSPVPPNDLITLAFLAGRYAGEAKCLTRYVWPHEWKGSLSKEVCARRVLKRLRPEERLIVKQCEKIVAKKKMHNVLDAIGIGKYFWGRP